ncbi:MAG: aminotransferase class V-fold PLP-dependent enzyme, partial [Helicobacter sp.]|nr:aminotransferase class V-fold PLP-dependent enzyme [Helicobacter sp.]
MEAEKFFAPLLQKGELEAQLRAKTMRPKKRLYFDWTASGLCFAPIERRIQRLLPFYANTHSDSNLYAQNIERLYQAAKQKIKDALNLSPDFALIATGCGASGAIQKFQELLGIYVPPRTLLRVAKPDKSKLPLVIVGAMEHHSNELSFREGLCEVVRLPLNNRGLVDLDALESVLRANNGREIIASFASASNVSGILLDCERASTLVRRYGGIVALDMASSSPHLNIPCALFDAAFFAPHKLLGGPGSCGLLAIRRELVDCALPPSFAGGGSVAYSSRSAQYYLDDIETREEAGTPPILQLLRAALAYCLREEVSRGWIATREVELAQYFLNL